MTARCRCQIRIALALPALLLAGLLVAGGANALSSYAIAAQDAPGSATGASSVALGVPDYAFVNDLGLGFGGGSSHVFGVGESTVLVFPEPLRNVAGQEDLLISAFVGGLGETDSALVRVDVSSNGVSFATVATFDTATGRTAYPFPQERNFDSVKHFAVDFGAADLVTHVRLTNLAGSAEGLRLDAVEGLHPDVASTHAFEIRFERYRPDFNQRFLVRIKNIADDGGVPIREFRIDRPLWILSTLEDTDDSLFGLDGEFLCVENCIPDNGPLIDYTRMAWSFDGVSEAPQGFGLEPGMQAANVRDRNFDLDTLETTYLSGYTFTVTFADGTKHMFDYDADVLAEEGNLYQKYLYFSGSPVESGPRPTDYYEFASGGPTCANGLDDDGDGFADYPDDPGCAYAADSNETSATLPCDDGADNDGDGLSDFPDDPGCGHPLWALEDPECNDGIDNDGDGQIDFPADPGCGASSKKESPQCNDGIDNDGDGLVDLADPHCVTASGAREQPIACGIGFELGLVMPLLAVWARRRSQRRCETSGASTPMPS
jgi:hypothetical protein